MQVRFWGTRGSLAKPGPGTIRYGGNTSCVEVRSASGTLVVIDCGTGAHGLGEALMAEPVQPVHGHLLISHTHWDHIQGIPFFAPLFAPENEWDIYGPNSLSQSIQETLSGQMQYTYFPVTLDALDARIRYHDLVEGEFRVGDITIRSHYLNHPALTLGYRLEADGHSVVYSCDHEPYARSPSTDRGGLGDQDLQHANFLRGADLVIHDAQYTEAEYPGKIGWGHSTAEYAVDICNAVGVKQLALTHHDPMRDDDAVDRIVAAMRSRQGSFGQSLYVFAASEGETVDLGTGIDSEVTHSRTAFSAVTKVKPAMSDFLIVLGATDAHTAGVIKSAAAAENVRLIAAASTEAALQAIATERPSLVIVDAQAAGDDALAIGRRLKEAATPGTAQPDLVVIADRDHPAPALAGFDPVWISRPFSREYARTRIRAWILRTTCRWVRAQIPPGEEARLAALDELHILDSEPEERFDRIVRIAAEVFDVPIALVSLVDRERQWFKSCFGLDVKETSRDMAFCAHAILKDEVMIVPDALLDPRFADNPLVTGEPHVRFYAGCPLKLPDGNFVGTLCLIDTRPRQIDDRKVRLLQDLGKLAELELARGPGPAGS